MKFVLTTLSIFIILISNNSAVFSQPNLSSHQEEIMQITPNDIIDFWFGTDPSKPFQNQNKWWQANPTFDETIKNKFGATHTLAIQEKLNYWLETPEGTLALIIVLDQFSRNLFRNSPKAWENDSLALEIAQKGIERGIDKKLSVAQRIFFYLPLEHTEDLKLQEKNVDLFSNLVDVADENIMEDIKINFHYAKIHRDIIAKFRRFPHRNKTLGRPSTPEEIEFLKQPNSSF